MLPATRRPGNPLARGPDVILENARSVTIERTAARDRQPDAAHYARPGGHAKWVRSPHGPATVSGEGARRNLFRFVTEAGGRFGKTASVTMIRKSGNLARGLSFLWRVRRQEGARCDPDCSSPSSLSLSASLSASARLPTQPEPPFWRAAWSIPMIAACRAPGSSSRAHSERL